MEKKKEDLLSSRKPNLAQPRKTSDLTMWEKKRGHFPKPEDYELSLSQVRKAKSLGVPERLLTPGFLFFIYLFVCLFVLFLAACELSLVVASRGYSSLRCADFSLWWLLLLQRMGSRCMGFSSCGTRASVVVARRL